MALRFNMEVKELLSGAVLATLWAVCCFVFAAIIRRILSRRVK